MRYLAVIALLVVSALAFTVAARFIYYRPPPSPRACQNALTVCGEKYGKCVGKNAEGCAECSGACKAADNACYNYSNYRRRAIEYIDVCRKQSEELKQEQVDPLQICQAAMTTCNQRADKCDEATKVTRDLDCKRCIGPCEDAAEKCKYFGDYKSQLGKRLEVCKQRAMG